MNTTTLPRSISHPPDTQDREVLHIPVPSDRRELALTDRLSLRIGLWLLLRAQRTRNVRRERVRGATRAPSRSSSLFDPARALSDRERLALLTFDLQRQIL